MSVPPNKLRSKLKGLTASRDATDNIKTAGLEGATKEQVDSLRSEGTAWTQVAADRERRHPDDEMPGAAFGADWDARYGKQFMSKANEKQSRIDKANSQLTDLGLNKKK